MKKTVITTPRLILRAITDKDENTMLDLFTDPIVSKTYMVPEFTNREAARPLFQRIKELSASERFVYGVYLGDALIGLVNETDMQGKTIELGFAFLPKYHNQGFATEVLIACTEALFASGYETVRTGAFEENLPSIRVMEKAGMVRLNETETIEYREKIHQCVFYERHQRNFS